VRLLLDTNVVLDIFLERSPHLGPAALLWAAIETDQAVGLIPAHGVTTLHYLIARDRGAREARDVVAQILTVCRVAPVDERVVRAALALEWPDFEDAVSAAAAERARCDLIVTRDPRGFRRARVTALDPATVLAQLRLR
jgi:predicted nucleic acid-binding protein